MDKGKIEMKDRTKKKRIVRSLINLLLSPSRDFLMSIIDGDLKSREISEPFYRE
jgi:hypothetical protein